MVKLETCLQSQCLLELETPLLHLVALKHESQHLPKEKKGKERLPGKCEMKHVRKIVSCVS